MTERDDRRKGFVGVLDIIMAENEYEKGTEEGFKERKSSRGVCSHTERILVYVTLCSP